MNIPGIQSIPVLTMPITLFFVRTESYSKETQNGGEARFSYTNHISLKLKMDLYFNGPNLLMLAACQEEKKNEAIGWSSHFKESASQLFPQSVGNVKNYERPRLQVTETKYATFFI